MKLKDVYESLVRESSLSRVWQFIEDPARDFAIVSASRAGNPDNDTRYFNLKKDVRALRAGYVELRGGFTETDPQTQIKTDVTEDSLLVSGIAKDKALELGKKYEQESILWKDATGLFYLSTKPENFGQVEMTFKSGKGKENFKTSQEAVAQYFSMLKKGPHAGKKFSYVAEAEDWNWRKEALREHKGYKRKWFIIYER